MKKINSTYVSLAALVLSIAAIVTCIVCCGCSKKSASIEEALKANPEMIVNAMKDYEVKMVEKQQEEAKKMISENLAEIQSANAGVIANPNGKIIITKFFDFSCGYCHKVAPTLLEIAAENPDVKIIARELTFLGPISQYAAKAVLAAKEQGKYAEVYKALITNEGRLTEEKVDSLAVAAGVNLEKLKTDMNSETVAKQLEATNEIAGKIKLRGVPYILVGDQAIQGLDKETILKAIEAAKK